MNIGRDETSKAGSCNMSWGNRTEGWLQESKAEKIGNIWKRASKLLLKRVEIITSLGWIVERQLSIEMSQLKFQDRSERWRNKSYYSVFSWVPEYRHIQRRIPILLPSGKASCGNSSDEAVETQSFNVRFLASEHTLERMTLDLAFK